MGMDGYGRPSRAGLLSVGIHEKKVEISGLLRTSVEWSVAGHARWWWALHLRYSTTIVAWIYRLSRQMANDKTTISVGYAHTQSVVEKVAVGVAGW